MTRQRPLGILFSVGLTNKFRDLGFFVPDLVFFTFLCIYFSIYVLFNILTVCNNAPNIVRVCFCGLVQYNFLSL